MQILLTKRVYMLYYAINQNDQTVKYRKHLFYKLQCVFVRVSYLPELDRLPVASKKSGETEETPPFVVVCLCIFNKTFTHDAIILMVLNMIL